MKFFFKFILPVILAVAVLIEGTSGGAKLMALPYDSAVLGGFVLAVATVVGFASFITWLVRRNFFTN